MTPYLFGGFSVFHFNPKADFGGSNIELQPLGTEGQGIDGKKKYKRIQFALPIGGGIKISVGKIGIGIEVGARRTYTDYLDDVSTKYIDPNLFGPAGFGFTGKQLQNAQDLASNQRNNIEANSYIFRKSEGGIRGNSKNKDSYFTFNIKLGLTFGRGKIKR